MDEKRYLISDAAKIVQAEPHVLRYWEEELELPIQRTELGHRYYTEEDIQTFQNIKELKDRSGAETGRAGEGESGVRGKYHSLPVESGSGQVSAV